jgi:hypothetical protein
MSNYGVYKTSDKKCATCTFWSGNRTIDFIADKPKYIKAEGGGATCIAIKGRTPTAATTCQRWQCWEKIFISLK